jgi:hypothetical protein
MAGYSKEEIDSILGPDEPAAPPTPAKAEMHSEEDINALLGPDPKKISADWDARTAKVRARMQGMEHGPKPDTRPVEAFEYGLGDPIAAGRQLVTAGLEGGDEAVSQAALREKEYQKRTEGKFGAERGLGGAVATAPAAFAAPTTMLGRVGLGAGLGLASQPAADSSRGLVEQKLEQGVEGAGLAALPGMLTGGIKYAARGGKAAAEKMAKNLADLRAAGIDRPTLGQVSEGGMTKGSGATKSIVDEQTQQVAAKADSLAAKLSQAKTPEEAGNLIIAGIEGERPQVKISTGPGGQIVSPASTVTTGPKQGGWRKTAQQYSDYLHGKVSALVPPDTSVPLTNTLKTLTELTTPSPTAPAVSNYMQDPEFREIMQRVDIDAFRPPGKPPTPVTPLTPGMQQPAPPQRALRIDDLSKLRSWIGKQTDPNNLAPKLDAQQASRLYAAIAADEEAAVASKGPAAVLASQQANQFTRTMHDTIADHLQPVLNAKTPENVLEAAMSGTNKGASRVRAVMQALDPVQADGVRSVVIRELGRSGEAFSAPTFIRNFQKMHPDARTELFGPKGSQLRSSLDKIADASAMLSSGDKSITAALHDYALEHKSAGGLATLAYLTHRAGVGAIAASGLVGFATGRMLRNPTIVNWLAKTTTKSTAALPMAFQQLQRLRDQLSPEDQAEVDQYLKNVQNDPMMVGQ